MQRSEQVLKLTPGTRKIRQTSRPGHELQPGFQFFNLRFIFGEEMHITLGRASAVCLVWLAVVSARPDAQHRHKQLLASAMSEEPSNERRVGVAADRDRSPLPQDTEQRERREMDTEPQPRNNRAWLHFFNDFMNKQKMFRGRTKKVTSKGCFGMRMDRIGSMSSLGC